MMRIIINSLKHLYYGTLLNLWVAKIDGFFKSRAIEKQIKKRGDTILSNRSHIGSSTYLTKNKNKGFGFLNSFSIHEGAYRFKPMYITQQQVDDISNMGSSKFNREDELISLLNVLKDAEEKVRIKNEANKNT